MKKLTLVFIALVIIGFILGFWTPASGGSQPTDTQGVATWSALSGSSSMIQLDDCTNDVSWSYYDWACN